MAVVVAADLPDQGGRAPCGAGEKAITWVGGANDDNDRVEIIARGLAGQTGSRTKRAEFSGEEDVA